MLGGLIAGALKGGAEGYTTVAKGELENQQRLDYATKILELQEQKDLRVDEIKRRRDITDIGPKAAATAAAAPVLAQGDAAAAPIRAAGDAAAAPVKAKGDVAASVAKIDAATEAGLPQKEGDYALSQINAKAPAIKAESKLKAEAEAAGEVAKVSVAGYVDALSKQDYAKSAGERSVAAITLQGHRETASKPSITQTSDGTYYTAVWDPVKKSMTTAVLTGPDGQPLKGTKDLDARTKAMVDAKLVEARGELDPDERKRIITEVTALLGGTAGAASGQALPAPKTRADLDRLPSGTRYTAPDGSIRIKQ